MIFPGSCGTELDRVARWIAPTWVGGTSHGETAERVYVVKEGDTKP